MHVLETLDNIKNDIISDAAKKPWVNPAEYYKDKLLKKVKKLIEDTERQKKELAEKELKIKEKRLNTYNELYSILKGFENIILNTNEILTVFNPFAINFEIEINKRFGNNLVKIGNVIVDLENKISCKGSHINIDKKMDIALFMDEFIEKLAPIVKLPSSHKF